MNRTKDPIDLHVGNRMKARRQLLGMSQDKLGTSVGVSFQQVQKYESGANRVGASRLMQMAKVLGTSVAFFFDGMTETKSKFAVAEDKTGIEEGVFGKKESIDLLKAYYALPENIRPQVLKMVKALNTGDLKPARASRK